MRTEHCSAIGGQIPVRLLWGMLVLMMAAPQAEAASSCVPPPPGLVGWWAGDGNALDSQGTNNGTLQGGATATAAGMVAQAFTFDGTNSYVQIPDSPALRPANLTIEGWVRFSSLDSAGLGGSPAGDQYIVFKQNTRSTDFEGFDLSKTRIAGGDVFRFLVTSATAQTAEIDSATFLAAGVWYHVAAVRGSNFTQIYVNGQLERQATVSFAQNYGSFPLYFGTSGQSYWDHKLRGSLDEISLYNRALSAAEISAIYVAGSAGKCKAGSAPVITGPPQNQTVAVGSNVGFSVTATGAGPLGYQWRFNGTAIGGATATNLSLTNVQVSDGGSYTVVVSNATASVTSAVALLTVLLPPAITSQPQSLTNVTGTTATFSATATGSAPLGYQWRLNGANLANGGRVSGARTNILSVTNVQPADAGSYTVVVSNAVGVVTSAVAVLNIIGPPAITSQPANQTVVAGGNAGFAVTASGTPPLGYQWLFNTAPVQDATNASLSLSNVQPPSAGSYSVIVTNPVGSVTSAAAVLTVLVPPNITAQPQSLTNVVGTTATFSAIATGTAPLSFQWQFNAGNLANGGRVSGARTNSLSITNLQATDAGSYTLVATNAEGAITSSVAVLTILSPPVIMLQPASQIVVTGANVSFGVSASGTLPLQYQWSFNNSPITAATSASLTVTNAQLTNAGSYSVLVTNIAGAATSAAAVLTVNTGGGCATPPAGLVGWWPGDGSAIDITGTNNGILQGGATANTAGKVSTAFHFDGTNGYVQIPDSTVLRPTNLTVECWVQFDSLDSAGNNPAGNSYIVFKQNTRTSTFEGYNLSKHRITGGDIFVWEVTSAAGVAVQINSLSMVSTGVWYHVAGVRGTNFIQLYVNGQLESQTNVDFPQDYGNYPLYFGTSGESYFDRRLAGSLDEVSLYNRALDGGEIAAIYAAGSAGKCKAATAPIVTSQPAGQTVAAGSTATFTVGAAGTGPIGYRWRLNGANLSDGGQISGSATPALSIANVQSNNAGSYSVILSNAVGSATSAVAVLSVTAPGNCLTPPQGLVGWWPGDGDATDAVGSDNGTFQGGATANGTGVVGLSFNLDGNSGYVQIPDSPALKPANLTVETWVNFSGLDSTLSGNAPAGDQYIVFKQNSRTYYFEGYSLEKFRIPGGDAFMFTVGSAAGQEVSLVSKTLVSPSVWYHVAAIRGSNFLQLYVNGKLESQTNVSFPQDYGTLPLFFGTSHQTYWDGKFKGRMDEVSLYNRALSSNEIAAAYAIGAGGKCKAAVGPTILTQPANQTLVLGGTATFTVTASGTAPLSYQWQKDGTKLINGSRISGATNSAVVLTSLQATDVGAYQVVVANSWGSVTSAVATLSTGVPPPNDAFSAAQTISGSSGSVVGSTFNATKQNGEPNHAGNTGGASVWYNWTAPSTSPVTFDTALSGFDTLLAVYTGSSINSLTPVASNNNATTNTTRSRVTFTPVSGTVYRVAVDGNNGASGSLTLRWAQASTALPDLTIVGSALNPRITTESFSPGSCAVMEGLIQAGTRRLIRFSTETENQGTANLFFGDPSSNPLFVWAPCHAHYHFNNYMAYRLRYPNGQIAAIGLKVGFCILDVFRWKSGSANKALYTCSNQGIQVGWGDLYDSTLDGQWIDITGLPDGNYTLEVEANPQGIIQEANYGNNITQIPIAVGNPTAPPLNDNFGSPQTLLGGFSSVPGVTVNATKQSGEPNHAGNVGGHSVWYQWTAVDTKAVTIDTLGSSFNTLLAVYTGSSLTGLTPIASNDDIGAGNQQSRVTFSATAGTVYQIAVDGYNGASGNLILTLTQTIQNDNFANPEFIGGVSGVAHGSNLGGTKEPGEPNHAGNSGGASIWYAWTAPIDGSATFDTIGSVFNTLLGAYTGNTVNSLTTVASNDDIDPFNGNLQSRITFNVTGLSRYYLAIDGYNGQTGDTTLNWNLVAGSMTPAALAGTASGGTPPVALSHSFLPEGEFQLVVTGQPEQSYLIERSCDLVTWNPLVTTMSDSSGVAYFVDKTTMHLDRQSASGDPVCGGGQIAGTALSPTVARFYRAIPVSAN